MHGLALDGDPADPSREGALRSKAMGIRQMASIHPNDGLVWPLVYFSSSLKDAPIDPATVARGRASRDRPVRDPLNTSETKDEGGHFGLTSSRTPTFARSPHRGIPSLVSPLNSLWNRISFNQFAGLSLRNCSKYNHRALIDMDDIDDRCPALWESAHHFLFGPSFSFYRIFVAPERGLYSRQSARVFSADRRRSAGEGARAPEVSSGALAGPKRYIRFPAPGD
jgi:hypothetical protein